MNAVREMVRGMARQGVLRLAGAIEAGGREGLVGETTEGMRDRIGARFELDLCGLLNRVRREELVGIAERLKIDATGEVGALRARLWAWGAAAECPGGGQLGTALQPVPILLGGKLVHQGALRGLAPPAPVLPRPVPPAVAAVAPSDEPDSVEELLAAADRLVGVRLGDPVRDKGAFGGRVAALLGVAERGAAEPDWRGAVEIKTVPVVRDRAGWWRVKEDPAVSMELAAPRAKLRQVLWVARVARAAGSPVLSWYFQEWDAEVSRLVDRHLHTRPKGGAGATTRGWYLQKRFFLDNGFLRSLNG